MSMPIVRATPTVAAVLLALAVGPGPAAAQNNPAWTPPFPPLRIAQNLYYIWSKGLAT